MPWRTLIFHNFVWKVAAIGLATLIWLTVRFGEKAPGAGLFSTSVVRQLDDIPVRVLTTGSDPVRFRVNPETISVTVRGDAISMRRLQVTDIEAYVNLADVESAQALQMRVHVYVPSGLRVEAVRPANARIEKLGGSGEARGREN